MKPLVAGISYRTAPLELRERLAVSSSELASATALLKAAAQLDEVVLLSTCNRLEIYGAAETSPRDAGMLFDLLAPAWCDWSEHSYLHEGPEALTHLFGVACGLDSMVLGETEITGQVKTAYERARAAGLTGRVLNQAFQKALSAAKTVRTQTQIGRGATSVGSAAVELAERIFGPALAEQTVMILGAGQMGEACVRHLARKGTRGVLVCNRSLERAQALAAECGGRAIPWEECLATMTEADIVIASTGCPTQLLRQPDVQRLMRTRRRRSLVLIDIAVPRNIDPAVNLLENVYLYDLDDLETIARCNRQQREGEMAACRQIIARAVAALWPRLAPEREFPGPARPDQSAWLLPGTPVPAAS